MVIIVIISVTIEKDISCFPLLIEICLPNKITGITIRKNGTVTNGKKAAKMLQLEKVKTGGGVMYSPSELNAKNDIARDNNTKKMNPIRAKNLCLKSYIINISMGY